jgi:hypothetical protein
MADASISIGMPSPESTIKKFGDDNDNESTVHETRVLG